MSDATEKFLFLATGGTIEFVAGKTSKVAMGEFETTYQPPNFRDESLIPEYLRSNYPDLQYDFEQICIKDGKDVSVRDLLQIEKAVLASKSSYVLVTHGTDTMVENAQMLEKWEAAKSRVIVFVGAFRPLENGSSDGDLNIAKAIEEAPHLSSGVYISSGGKIHKCKEVVKDFDRGEFVGI